MKKTINKKVFVALSGGVDSAVAAALLQRANYQVTGVFLKLFKNHSEETAQQVARRLNLPFLVFDFQSKFKKEVIDYFLREYKKGRTPNPCVVCNQKIKFDLFFKEAKKRGADFIATGHYVKLKKVKNELALFQAKDRQKDQSYFLWGLPFKKLRYFLFPLGNLNKQEVISLAQKLSLPVKKEESFDVCFLLGQDYRDYFKKYLSLKPGPIVDLEGNFLGEHQGLPLYTVGQRKKIKLNLPGPYYVVRLDYKKNSLIVSRKEKDLYQKELIAEKVNWLTSQKLSFPFLVKAKIRYHHPGASAVIQKYSFSKKRVWVSFKKPQRAITPGQSIVFYQGQRLLGGGIIV